MRTAEQWHWRGTVRVVVRDKRGRFAPGGRTFRNLIVDTGLNLLRDGLMAAVSDTSIKYVALGTGCGVLGTAVSSGVAITSLTMASGIPHALTAGQGLTVINGTTSETVVVATGGAASGATTIPINSWTPTNSYVITTTSVVPTPIAGDTTLHNETFRKAVTQQTTGASAGQAVTTLYIAPQDANVVIAELGWFAGSTTTATANSGVMIARTLYNHQHGNLESIEVQRTDTL